MRASRYTVLGSLSAFVGLNSLVLPALALPPPPPPPPGQPAPAAPAPAPKPAEAAAAEKPKKKRAPAPKPADAVPRPAPRSVAPPAPAAAPPAAAPSSAELEALREEVKALREELSRAVGAPAPAAAPAPAETSAERARLEAEFDAEKKRLESIQAAVAAGLDPNTVADAVKMGEARIAELEASLATLAAAPAPAAPPAPVRSLHEVSAAVDRLDATLAEKPSAPPAVAAEKPPAEVPGEEQEKAELLPLELTAFGDFHYGFYQNAPDGFGIGAVEVDASLNLTPFVLVSVALAYSGADDAFGLGAFVVDCGLAGEGEGFLVQSRSIQQSGVAFGKFDVPFGIAYLEYAAVDNRLASTPEAVLATHGAWNDLGMQAHAVGQHWTALAYLVNGPDVPVLEDTTVPSLTALGGRVSGKLDGVFEVGGSVASTFADGGVDPLLYAGGDVTGIVGPLDVRAEYLLRRTQAPGATPNTHGVYGRAVLDLEPAFLVGRFDGVYADADPVDRRIAAGGGVVVFPQGEVRAVYNQSLDLEDRSVIIELVGGSTFQPTGLRR
jgi:hypothetical protein